VVEALDSYVEDVTKERDSLKKQCYDGQKEIQSMLTALKDVDSRMVFGTVASSILGDLNPPYKETCDKLQVAKTQLDSIFNDRLVKANDILEELKQLAAKLDNFAVPTDVFPAKNNDLSHLDLSNSRISELEQELRRWRQEYKNRVNAAAHFATQIVALWADLGTAQNEIDSNILNCYRSKPEELGTKKADLEYLETCCSSLQKEKAHREERLASYKKEVHNLWQKLNEDGSYTKEFEKANRGIGLNVLEEYQKELDRLAEKKREHIHLFIQDAREKLQDLWAQLYLSEEEALQFTPAWTDIYTDASLDAHEGEIERLEGVLQHRRPILNMIQVYQNLQTQADELEASMQDPSRLLSRGPAGRLLKEEQTRKRLAKQMPKVINDLQAAINSWEQTYGGRFLVNGEVFLETLEQEAVKYLPKQTPRRPGFKAGATVAAQNKQSQHPTNQMRSPIKTRTVLAPTHNTVRSTNVGRPAGRELPPRIPQGVVKQPNRGPPRPIPVQQSQNLKKLQPGSSQNYSRVLENETPVPVRGRGQQGVPASSTLRPTYLGKENVEMRPPIDGNIKLTAAPLLSPKRIRTTTKEPSPFRETLQNRLNGSPTRSPVHRQERHQEAPYQDPQQSPDPTARNLSTSTTVSKTSRIMSNQSAATSVTALTENWTTYEDASSSGDEETDTDYLRWRQNAMTKLQATSPAKNSRVSEFNWDKDTF
jgi:protein regulator of cytokinesis 1